MEVMVVVAIIGIGSAMAFPSMTEMVHEYRLRSMAREVLAGIQDIRLMSINENVKAGIAVDEGSDTYTLFVDTNQDWNLDASEAIQTVDVRAEGLEIEKNGTEKTMGFNSRGIPEKFGTITLRLGAARQKTIQLTMTGNIRVN